MIKLLSVPLLLFALVSMAACGGSDDAPFASVQPPTSEQPGGSDTDNDDAPERPSSLKVRITVGPRTVTATIEDNAAGRDFLARLPLEVALNDYANTAEKIFYPAPPLAIGGIARGCTPAPGDIAIYAPWGNVAIFCRSASFSRDLLKIGRIDGDGISALTLPGDLQVRFERQE